MLDDFAVYNYIFTKQKIINKYRGILTIIHKVTKPKRKINCYRAWLLNIKESDISINEMQENVLKKMKADLQSFIIFTK